MIPTSLQYHSNSLDCSKHFEFSHFLKQLGIKLLFSIFTVKYSETKYAIYCGWFKDKNGSAKFSSLEVIFKKVLSKTLKKIENFRFELNKECMSLSHYPEELRLRKI